MISKINDQPLNSSTVKVQNFWNSFKVNQAYKNFTRANLLPQYQSLTYAPTSYVFLYITPCTSLVLLYYTPTSICKYTIVILALSLQSINDYYLYIFIPKTYL